MEQVRFIRQERQLIGYGVGGAMDEALGTLRINATRRSERMNTTQLADIYTILWTDETLKRTITKTNVMIAEHFGDEWYYQWIGESEVSE